MTLTKAKPKSRTTTHRKRNAAHHQKGKHYLQPYWPYIPIIAILICGLFLNTTLARSQRSVLGYATDMSASGLLNGTNNQRVANGLGALAINGLLNQAAQSKANDMVSRDYWSHNTPDGQTPWTFVIATGYGYQTAGENLAYGFTSSSETITGWMNSPGHRANILNESFQEVGFGIANSQNFLGGGPQTVVVAMYALPTAAPAPTPTPTPAPAPATTPTPTIAPTPVQQPQSTVQATETAPTPVAESVPTPAETQASPNNESVSPKNSTKLGDTPEKASAADTVPSQDVSRIQVMSTANVAWGQFAVSMLASVALLAFLLRHSFAWHRMLVRGEQFVLHHPYLDIAFVAIAVLGFILLQSAGTIR